MARVTDRDSGRELVDATEIRGFLANHGIWYREFEGPERHRLDEQATDDEILAVYAEPSRSPKTRNSTPLAIATPSRPISPGSPPPPIERSSHA